MVALLIDWLQILKSVAWILRDSPVGPGILSVAASAGRFTKLSTEMAAHPHVFGCCTPSPGPKKWIIVHWNRLWPVRSQKNCLTRSLSQEVSFVLSHNRLLLWTTARDVQSKKFPTSWDVHNDISKWVHSPETWRVSQTQNDHSFGCLTGTSFFWLLKLLNHSQWSHQCFHSYPYPCYEPLLRLINHD